MTTKNKMLKQMPLAVAISAAMIAAPAVAVDFFGYARAGIGNNVDGGKNSTFQAAGASTKYRLGNENDAYAEFGLGSNFYEQDGMKFRYELMLAFGGHEGNNSWEDVEVNLTQSNVQAEGVLGFAPEATLWAGKRNYKQHDVHMNDFFYVGNTGAGAGIEGIQLGDLDLSVAWVRTTAGEQAARGTVVASEEGVANDVIDLRLKNIPVMGNTTLELMGFFAAANEIKGHDVTGTVDNGQMYTAEFTTGGNKFVMQYATDSMALSGAAGQPWATGNEEGGNMLRILNHGAVELAPNVEMIYNVMYEDLTLDNGEGRDWVTAGVRPVYKWNEVMSTQLELGYDHVALDVMDHTNKVAKATIAQQWAAGSSVFSRPAIRAYATYAKWNDQFDTDGKRVDSFMGNAGSEMTYGVQFEAWF